MTVGNYYTKLKSLWDERDALHNIPRSTCGVMKDVLQFQQNQKTIKFLMELHDMYTNVRGQILLMDPLPTVNKAYLLVRQEKKQREVTTRDRVAGTLKASAFAARNNIRRPERVLLSLSLWNNIKISLRCLLRMTRKWQETKQTIISQVQSFVFPIAIEI